MTENHHKTVSLKLKNGTSHSINVYWDNKVFPKKGDERVVDALIEEIKEDPEEFLKIIRDNGEERLKCGYNNKFYTIEKNHGSPALLITK